MAESPSEFAPSPSFAASAVIGKEEASSLRAHATENESEFWRTIGSRLTWSKPFSRIKDVSFDIEDFRIKWFDDGQLNASVNCIDRHLPENSDRTAIIWEGDDPADTRHITYRELHAEVCRMANILKARDVKKGDRVVIYMPLVPEAAYAMLACARIGAVHSVVFGGFSPDALASRIEDCGARTVITADEGVRGGKTVPLKNNVDAALVHAPDVRLVLVVRRTGGDVEWEAGRDIWWHEAREDVSPECDPETMNAEDPLFILYTS
ncbi:MAG: AMP-binding protein, partial [Pseudomonadota bacterium]